MFARLCAVAFLTIFTSLAALVLPPVLLRADEIVKATKPCANPSLPVAILHGPPAAADGPALRTVALRTARAWLRLAVADTPEEREVGLMCVTALRPRAGMIFVFASDSRQTFWMKHTLIPLDMVWVHQNGRVDTVAAHVPAATLSTSDADVARRAGEGMYVIELAAGEARRAGIVPHSKLALPALHAHS